MASLRRRTGSRFWYACVTLPNGKRRQFSTRTTDEAEALEIAQRLENALIRERTERRLRDTFDRLLADTLGTSTADPGAWVLAWAARKSSEVAPRTAGKYDQIAKIFKAFLQREKITTFAAIDGAAIIRLRDEWQTKHSAGTVNGHLKIIRIALNDAVRDHHLTTNPAALVRGLRTSKEPIKRAFTPLEISALLAAASSEWRAYITLALYTGQRRNDLAGLTWSNIDTATERLTFQTSKTGRTNTIPLVQTVIDSLLTLPAGDKPTAPLFPVISTMSGQAISHAFRRIMVSAGLVPARPSYKGLKKTGIRPTQRTTAPTSFHSLRHTATSFLKAAGVADAIVQSIIGHASKAQSDHYTHIDLDTLRTGIEKMETRLKP